MAAAGLVVLAFLAGSVPFGLIILRLAGGPDPRTVGSGNIGATNVVRAGGRALGAFTLLLDAGKGLVPVLVALRHPEHFGAGVPAAAALAAVLGHCFPPWLRFAGGKGVATLLGAGSCLLWPLGLPAFLAAFLAVTRVSGVVALGSVAAVWALAGLAAGMHGLAAFLAMTAAALVVTFRHRPNFERMRQAAPTAPKEGDGP